MKTAASQIFSHFIAHPQVIMTWEVLAKAFDQSSRNTFVLLFGDPCVGKTTLIEKFSTEKGESIAYLHFPPLHEFIPYSILNSIYPDLAKHIKKATSFDVVKSVLRAKKVRMIVLDDFHHILWRTQRAALEIIDYLLYLSNCLNICFVFVGLPDAIDFLKGYPEINERLVKIKISSLSSRDYSRFLSTVATKIGISKPSQDIEQKLFALTGGFIYKTLSVIHDVISITETFPSNDNAFKTAVSQLQRDCNSTSQIRDCYVSEDKELAFNYFGKQS